MSDPSHPSGSGHPHARRWFLGVTASLSALVMVASAIVVATYGWADSNVGHFGTY